MSSQSEFISLNIAILTVSDTRSLEEDSSGRYLAESLEKAGHRLVERSLVPDDVYKMRAVVSQWIADSGVQVILTTGGTGFTLRDSTPEALQPLLDQHIPGYGEIFRMLSLDDIGTSTVQSRAFAGLANQTLLFALPGSTGACRLGWEKIICEQLDSRHSPCNFAGLLVHGRHAG